MRCAVLYSKKRDVYEIRIDDPFATPVQINEIVFREFLRKHGRGKDDSVPLSGMIHVYRNELSSIL
jgi:hypothetical protein